MNTRTISIIERAATKDKALGVTILAVGKDAVEAICIACEANAPSDEWEWNHSAGENFSIPGAIEFVLQIATITSIGLQIWERVKGGKEEDTKSLEVELDLVRSSKDLFLVTDDQIAAIAEEIAAIAQQINRPEV